MSEQFFENAELLMDLKGYKQESLTKSENAINIKVSQPDSDDTILMHIPTMTTIDIDQAKTAIQLLNAEAVDKLFIFANKFTKAAKVKLNKSAIECFTEELNISTVIPPV
jgi:hypothetical protein